MRTFLTHSLFLATVLVLSACGGGKAGEKCDTSGFLCADATNALECKLGVWETLPCKGSNGCTRTGDTVKCDMSGNAEGDNCASSAEGKGLCTGDGLGTLQCLDGKLQKNPTPCRTCTITGESVICQP